MRFSVVHSTVEQVEDEGRTMERKYREIESGVRGGAYITLRSFSISALPDLK